jgi:hypothetical protein
MCSPAIGVPVVKDCVCTHKGKPNPFPYATELDKLHLGFDCLETFLDHLQLRFHLSLEFLRIQLGLRFDHLYELVKKLIQHVWQFLDLMFG